MAEDPRALLQKADKTLQGASGGFSFFSNKTEKFENAADLYTQAANGFRVQKMDREAGKAFERAAAVHANNLNEPDDAANSLAEAYKVYKRSAPEEGVRVLLKVVQHHISKGNFRRAAGYQKDLGDLYKDHLNDDANALEAYEKAADWYLSDGAEAMANKYFVMVADLAAMAGDYYKAVEIFEKVARSYMVTNKFSVKENFMKAAMCHLASKDLVATNRALQSYCDLDPTFNSTREYHLLADLTHAVEQGDQDAFGDLLFEYDKLIKLDRWKTHVFLHIKNNIEEAGEDFS
ncbi:vesicular-fusion protein S17 [Myotisia sp. PD_48]|nr:vesicular-fusion protein S17 [Myotisia sp. PD_48]